MVKARFEVRLEGEQVVFEYNSGPIRAYLFDTNENKETKTFFNFSFSALYPERCDYNSKALEKRLEEVRKDMHGLVCFRSEGLYRDVLWEKVERKVKSMLARNGAAIFPDSDKIRFRVDTDLEGEEGGRLLGTWDGTAVFIPSEKEPKEESDKSKEKEDSDAV